ncbi:serine/threonine-protein kinase [Polyangium sp. 6x1]|uniref:serine/threonine-protein kinase n=1 Tax=Polyangium sp. 6x1 TaxID=3042689 RepID=UPI002482EC5E|nr:serine/threonine-protein kinase [Polyangium sp. 6x1]MDI1445043.1 serine/threonine-protein kinase [Polyangium sp. 6x1]
MTAALAAQPTPTPPPSAVPSSRRKQRASRRLPCKLGPYTLFERIGYGGMANVYLARRKTELGAFRLCVIKEVLPELAHDARMAEMLAEEARITSLLRHKNVVEVHDLGRDGESLYLAMEYVEGFDLRELLRRAAAAKVPFPVAYSLMLVGEVLCGLDYAHRLKDEAGAPLGIVHRDVSPANVLVSFEGEVKLCDFGIARAGTVEGVDTAFQGKAGYMSPEQARGEALTATSDVFAVGIILWELLAGRRLYKAQPGESLLQASRRAEIPELPSRGLPEEEELFGIVRRALARDEGERYPTAAAMLRDIEAYAAKTRMLTSSIQFGAWLTHHFGKELISERRARQRAIEAIERGPVAVITPIGKRARPANGNAAQKNPNHTPTPPTQRVVPRKEAVADAPPSGVRQARSLDPAEREKRLAKKRRKALKSQGEAGALMKIAPREASEGGYAGAILLLAAAMVAGLVMLQLTTGG